MLFAICVIGISATKDQQFKIPKAKAAKTKTKKLKTTDKNYEGEYLRATNTFVYTKDNLVFPNKIISYTVKDESGLLDGIYNFAAEKYGVTEADLIGLNVSGTISKKDKVITIKKITNYQIPKDKILGEEKHLELMIMNQQQMIMLLMKQKELTVTYFKQILVMMVCYKTKEIRKNIC